MYKILLTLLFAYGLAITTEDIYDNSYALIIGIDKYENVSNLDYAVKDANSVAALLKDNFDFPLKNIKVLLNDEATYSNVRNSLAEISLSAKENDRVLIYFAGHGETMDLPDGGELGYLLPVDGNADNLYVSSIGMDELKKISSMSKSKHMLFLIDACYGGLAATGARGIDSKTPNYIDKITRGKSRQIITAGGRGEQVIEKSEWGHSAFTMNLMRGLEDGKADLNNDGYITAEELGLFLKEKVTIDSNNQQTPQSRRFTSQEGEFIFIANEINVQINNTDAEIDQEHFNDKAEFDYEELARLLKIEQLFSDSTIHTRSKAKSLLKINPIGLIIGGSSYIGYERYIRDSWTLNYRINYFRYKSENYSDFIYSDNNKYDISGLGLGVSSTKYFTPSLPFIYNGINSTIGLDIYYNNVESTFTAYYENPDREVLETTNMKTIILGLSLHAGPAITIFESINIKPNLGIAMLYEINAENKEAISGIIIIPSLELSYILDKNK